MKKIISLLILTCSYIGYGQAQGILNRLARGAKNAAENAVQRNVERQIDNAIDDAFNSKEQQQNNQENNDEQTKHAASGWTCPNCGHDGNTGNFCNECGSKKPTEINTWTCEKCGHKGNSGNFCNECGSKKGTRNISSTYVKSDFIPGDEVIFEDDFANEQIGEFPSKWDLVKGTSEIVKFDGKAAVSFEAYPTIIKPLMKNPTDYLTDQFTIEFDFFAGDNSVLSKDLYSRSLYYLLLFSTDGDNILEYSVHTADSKNASWYYRSTSGQYTNADTDISNLLKDNTWNHFALSFNKRALKVYINGIRVTNVPNMAAPSYLELKSRDWSDHGVNYITDFRVCQGAVPLYDRLTTDGKIITYAITFETGKAELKPESYTEIYRIAQLMKDNPSIKFEVQGHCDNTGSDKINDPLSQKRAEAIVSALVELDIEANRLTAVGKGSHNPIADNSTEEGRSKNRRVEFIKQ